MIENSAILSRKDSTIWYQKEISDVASFLNIDLDQGLTFSEAAQRIKKYGPNKLAAKKKESGLVAFLRQYKDLMQIVLFATAIINLIFTDDFELGTIGLALPK